MCLNTSIHPQNQPKKAEFEAKSPQKAISKASHRQRHSFLLTAAAQHLFVQRFPRTGEVDEGDYLVELEFATSEEEVDYEEYESIDNGGPSREESSLDATWADPGQN